MSLTVLTPSVRPSGRSPAATSTWPPVACWRDAIWTGSPGQSTCARLSPSSIGRVRIASSWRALVLRSGWTGSVHRRLAERATAWPGCNRASLVRSDAGRWRRCPRAAARRMSWYADIKSRLEVE